MVKSGKLSSWNNRKLSSLEVELLQRVWILNAFVFHANKPLTSLFPAGVAHSVTSRVHQNASVLLSGHKFHFNNSDWFFIKKRENIPEATALASEVSISSLLLAATALTLNANPKR